MKKLIIAFVCFAFVGCRGKDIAGEMMQENQKNKILVHGYSITIIEYDGCQYLVLGIGYSQMITHKGNCNNPIHSKH